MKDIEIKSFKDYCWGSIVRVKSSDGEEIMINAKVSIIAGSIVLASVVFFLIGFLIGICKQL